MSAPCPICQAPYGFHERVCGSMRLPDHWTVTAVADDGEDIFVTWSDGAGRTHVTASRRDFHFQRGAENVVVPLAPWAVLL